MRPKKNVSTKNNTTLESKNQQYSVLKCDFLSKFIQFSVFKIFFTSLRCINIYGSIRKVPKRSLWEYVSYFLYCTSRSHCSQKIKDFFSKTDELIIRIKHITIKNSKIDNYSKLLTLFLMSFQLAGVNGLKHPFFTLIISQN